MKEDGGSECSMSEVSAALIAAGMGVGVSFKIIFELSNIKIFRNLRDISVKQTGQMESWNRK